MQCWFYYNSTKPKVFENRIFEGTDCLQAALRHLALQVARRYINIYILGSINIAAMFAIKHSVIEVT